MKRILEEAKERSAATKRNALTEESVPESARKAFELVEKCSVMDVLSPLSYEETKTLCCAEYNDLNGQMATQVATHFACLRIILPTCPANDTKKMNEKKSAEKLYSQIEDSTIVLVKEWASKMKTLYPKTYDAYELDIVLLSKRL